MQSVYHIVAHRSGSFIKLITQEDFMAVLASYFVCCLIFSLSCTKQQTSSKFLRRVLSHELNFNFNPYYLVLDPFASFSRNSSECFWIRATGTKCWPATGTYITSYNVGHFQLKLFYEPLCSLPQICLHFCNYKRKVRYLWIYAQYFVYVYFNC
jgi:hypothetical protein